MDISKLSEQILQKNIVALGKAITLNESTRLQDNQVVDQIISQHSHLLNDSMVISISGIPGVGKSSFIEVFGKYLHDLGHSIAIFTIDPSSELNHGSILGDKTRMNELSQLQQVFIRPSPSSNRLGGLGINTHKNIDIAKIAGFDIILIETVGVGQSETIVKNLCDLFVLLLMPASGDELQGIKKGIMEVADYYIIHKADGVLETVAELSKKEIEISLHLTKSDVNLEDKIFTFSSVKKQGMENIWTAITKEIETQKASKEFYNKRTSQRLYWLDESIDRMILTHYKSKLKSEISLIKDKAQKGEAIDIHQLLK